MAVTGRWFEAPVHKKHIGHRLTIVERIQRWHRLNKRRKDQPDVLMVTGFFQPVYPRR